MIEFSAHVSGDSLLFYANTHRFDTGAATDADSAPAYRIYRIEDGTPVTTGTMALLDSANTAGFYSEAVSLAGYDPGEYVCYISATVNSVTGTKSFPFTVGQGAGATVVRTTIATLASQTSFTLTGGPADNNALNRMMIVVRDAASVDQFCVGLISAYTGASKTVTLAADPGIFTMAVGDFVEVIAIPRQLPNAEAEAAGGLYTRGSGAGQINQNANGQIDSRTVAMAADVVTAAAIADGAIDAGALAAGAITAAKIATDAIGADEFAQAAADKVWSSALRSLTVFGFTVTSNLTQILGTALTETLSGYLAAAFKKFFDIAVPVFTTASVNQTGDSFSRLGAPAGASVSADVAAVKAETASIQADTNDIQARIPAALSANGNIKANVKEIEDQLTSGNNATLKLKQLHIVNNAGDGFVARSTGGAGNGITADGIGYGIQSSGAVTGIYAYSSSGPGHGISALGSAGHGLNLEGEGASGKSLKAPQGIAPDDGINLNVGSIADKLLGRSLAGGADGGRTVRQALRVLRNLRQIIAGVLTVYQEDDITPDWTASVTQTPGDPISKIDPT